MKKITVLIAVGVLLLSACTAAERDAGRAKQALVAFFEALNQGRYQDAASLYAGSYEDLVAFNPGLDPDDHAALWRNGCQVNGLQCLAIRAASFNQLTPQGEYVFTVQFDNPDGSRFIRGACCGDNPTAPPAFQFEYRLVKSEDGQFRVLDMPVYVP